MSLVANVGSTDKTIRILAGIALIVAAFVKLGGVAAPGGLMAMIVGLVLVATAVINFCPLYRILGLRTIKSSN